MSKKNSVPVAAAVLLAVTAMSAASLLAAGAASVTARQREARPAATSMTARSAAVTAATAEVLRQTSELRKLPVLRAVRSGTQSRAEIERMILRKMDESSTPEETRAAEQALKKLGLIPADFQLRSFIVKLLTEQVAGYYDTKTHGFNLAEWISLEEQRPVMAHELTHALQDQHFNLRRFEHWPKGDADAELAAEALIEGDATLAMTFYAMRYPALSGVLKSSDEAEDDASDELKRAPRALRELLLFPYEHGLTWAFQVHKRGGWDGLSQAFTKLPQSTEQILHPEKYFAREAPHKVEAPNLSTQLGAGWRRTDDDVHGEWGLYLALNEHLADDAESRKAAAGWGGDRFALYEGTQVGDAMIAQITVWDTEQDAREFFAAYTRRTTRRYRAEKMDDTKQGQFAVADSYQWKTGEGAVLIERRGSRVAILEGVPEKASASRLMRVLWRQS